MRISDWSSDVCSSDPTWSGRAPCWRLLEGNFRPPCRRPPDASHPRSCRSPGQWRTRDREGLEVMSEVRRTAAEAAAPDNVIAFQGAPGAYSDMDCREARPQMTTLPCASFEATFAAVRDGRARPALLTPAKPTPRRDA